MRQPATLTPDGGIPADCTDAWSEEQALSEPYREVFWRQRAEPATKRMSGWSRHAPHHCRSSGEACGGLKPNLVNREAKRGDANIW